MTNSDTAKNYLAKILAEMERLTKEVIRLKEDVAKLSGRIEPFDDEKPLKFNISEDDIRYHRPKNLDDLLNCVGLMRASIKSMEYDFSAVRGKVDNIAQDGISRDEMKPWLKG